MKYSVTRVMLQPFSVFHSLTEEQWQYLSENVTHGSFGKNKKIFQVGEETDFVFLVDKGSVKIGTYSDPEKVLIKEMAYPGDMFGENIFTQGPTRTEFAEATTDTRVFKIPVKVFKSLVLENAAFTNAIMSISLGKLEAMEERLKNFVFMKAKERIVHFLHSAALRKGINIGMDEKLINHGISHKDIAYLTDTSRQTVARVLNELKRDNLIHYGGGKSCKILVRDMFALEKLSLVS